MHEGRTRIAVIGAGPSGLYAAAALLASGLPVGVEVLDRLPAPYGLVRYGVAPDHVKMKSVIRVLQRPFDPAEVEFLGGVRIGEGGVPLDELRRHFHAIVHATGSSVDRSLDVPGEDLAGSFGSGPFVSWYCGHPDFVRLDPVLDHPGVAVVGAGNVALDVARVLARDPEEMAATDVPEPVLERLRGSAVRDVHVLIRRGPQHVRFTPAELRQIGDLSGVDVLVHDDGLLAAGVAEPDDRRQRQNLDILRAWAAAPPSGGNRRIHLRFLRSPTRLVGSGGRVAGIEVERNSVDGDRVRGTGALERLDVGLVVRAIGYRAEEVPGLPFDERAGIVPNEAGRVVRDGVPVPGAYVTGWIKRGPTGVIGTNKSDATETVAAVLADLPYLPEPPAPEPAALQATLAAHGIEPVDWAGWLRLDAEEVRRGGLRAAERVKVADMAEMLEHARGSRAAG
jgi:ferredoxin/flavodoxin---NADP+ reductase